MEIVITVVAGIIGLLVGGVINVLADDLPDRGRPHAPHYPDGSPRPVSAWLGVTAFLTGERASSFDPTAWLSWRHPITEVVTAIFFAAIALGLRGELAPVPLMVYVAVLILITVIDVEHRLILFMVVLPACLFALIVAAVAPGDERTFTDYALGGVEGFALFFAMFLGGVVFSEAARTGEVAFGFGDVMLATLSGLMLGWRAFIFAALITVFVGALGAVVYLAARAMMRQRYKLFTPLPYGPYIVIATLIMLLFRDEVQRLIQGS